MEVSTVHQMNVFFLCVISGAACGLFFDIQRSLRRFARAGILRTSLQDILFALVYIGTAFYCAFCFNNGEIRYYQIMGVICGMLVYAALLSKTAMKILVFVFGLFIKIVIAPICALFHAIGAVFTKIKSFLCRLFGKIRAFFKKFCVKLKKRKNKLKKRIKML